MSFHPGCTGKMFYGSFKSADTGARNLRRHKREVVHAYKCHHCEGFHVGHPHDEDARVLRKRPEAKLLDGEAES